METYNRSSKSDFAPYFVAKIREKALILGIKSNKSHFF